MARQESSGTLLFRYVEGSLEVLIVHPAGDKNASWSIPKGKLDEGETLEAAARRETWEETGVIPEKLDPLGFVVYKSKSKKKVHCFYGKAPTDAVPKCAVWEIDKAEFVSPQQARKLLHSEQKEFIDKLLEKLQ